MLCFVFVYSAQLCVLIVLISQAPSDLSLCLTSCLIIRAEICGCIQEGGVSTLLC